MNFKLRSRSGFKEKNPVLRKIITVSGCMFLLLTVEGGNVWASPFLNSHQQLVKISFKMQNVTVQEVLASVERQTNYRFTYNPLQIGADRRVTIDLSNKSVTEILDELFLGKKVQYVVDGNNIVLFIDGKKAELKGINQQKIKVVKGTVKDNTGEVVIGANVIDLSVPSNGTITDIDGNFTLQVSDDTRLQISYIGYNSKEISVKGVTDLQIILDEDSEILDEVVVVGYGTQKKVNLTGSVSSVNSEDIKDRVQNDVLSSIQGTVPGVTVVSHPGKDASINFRGRGNLGISEPLYVIDGAIANAAFFSNLDPNSIESISFLKDAASSAIYGSRAAYGVVLVTTKQGKDGRMDVSYSGMVGMKAPTYKADLVNSWEYAELYNEALYNTNPSGGKNQSFTNEQIELFRNGSQPDLYPNTNWMDLLFDDWAVTTKHSLNFSGGTKKLRYFAGLGYIYDTENLRN